MNRAGQQKAKSGQLSGLALIESLYFRSGRDAAQNQLHRLLGSDQANRSFALCDSGRPAIGLNIRPSDDITYESFGAPVFWNAMYSIQKVRFGAKIKDDFVFHPGEEILIPARGDVAYHFFWSPGASRPERVLLNPPATAGEILRINPQIPHHAWAAQGEATAWLVLRHAMNSPVALVMDRDSLRAEQSYPDDTSSEGISGKASERMRGIRQNRISLTDLRKPGVYAMVAWGISESIRDARLKAGLSPTELARQIGVDPSSISRLEEAKTNVSVEMLAKVCSALRIGVAGCMESGSWIYHRHALDSDLWNCGLPSRVGGNHALHVAILRLDKGSYHSAPTFTKTDSVQLSSWIVLSGRLMADLPRNMEGKSLILDTENVIHFRDYGEVALQALEDSVVAQVICSPICPSQSKGQS